MIAAGVATAAAVMAVATAAARAEDNQAGTPLNPAEAAGAWTVSTDGHDVCVLTLGKSRGQEAGYAVRVPSDCATVLPRRAAGWETTADGMALVADDGRRLIAFDRWSNSLLVSHRDGAADIQLRRGEPAA
jgi:hypothetical protein